MPSEVSQIAVAAVAALGAIVVAWISNRSGKKIAGDNPPKGSGEHVHTRDLVKSGLRLVGKQLEDLEESVNRLGSGMHRRFDVLEETRAAERKSQALGDAQRRLDEREGE